MAIMDENKSCVNSLTEQDTVLLVPVVSLSIGALTVSNLVMEFAIAENCEQTETTVIDEGIAVMMNTGTGLGLGQGREVIFGKKKRTGMSLTVVIIIIIIAIQFQHPNRKESGVKRMGIFTSTNCWFNFLFFFT